MSTYQALIVSQDNGVAIVSLNRAERKNALGPEMISELIGALASLHEDTSVRVIVLSAQGKVFSAGGDLGRMSAGSDVPLRGDYADLLLAMLRAEKPIIARVHGHAMGGGLGLVAASTFAVLASDAQLGTPEINVGLFPMMIMAVLARTVPRRALLEMMLRGQKLNADDALRLGLVNRVVAPEALDQEVRALASDLAARSPTAMRHGLKAWASLGDMTLSESLPWLRDRLFELLGTEDAQEGLMAFMEKRAPVWTGR